MILGASGFQAFAQDPEFTQFYAAPIYTNPAMAGSAFCGRDAAGRFSINYRNQWPSLPGTYRTLNASYDQHIEAIGGGLGLMATRDVAGAGLLTTVSFSGIYSYFTQLSKNFYLRAGIQASFNQKSIDFDRLKWPDQINPTSGFTLQTNEPRPAERISYPNFAAGLMGYSERFYIGAAVHNLTEPVQSFYNNGNGTLPRRYTVHAGSVLPLDHKKNSENTISPNILFMMQQNFTQLNFGVYANKGPLVAGLWFRQTVGYYGNSDALIALIGFRKDRFKFGYSYDITVSSAKSAVPGSHEVSATIEWCTREKSIRFKPLICPSF